MSKVHQLTEKRKKLKAKQDILATHKNHKGRNQQYVYESRPEENGNGAQSFCGTT